MKKRTIISISSLTVLAIVIAYIIIRVFTPGTPGTHGTVLYVEPQTTSKLIDQDFAVNISISNVTDLFTSQFKLTWDPTILDLLNITEGPFPKSGGTTIWYPEINSSIGYVFAVCSLTGSETISGNGVLATVYFHVKGNGSCDLDLSEITLYNSAENLITNRIVDGQFHT